MAARNATKRPLPALSGGGGPKINPSTGLSTDYLNHFTEAVMILEMAAVTPECLDDLRNWRPKTYAEHFAASRFSNRTAVIAAYHAADPAVRAALDATSADLNRVLVETREHVKAAASSADALARGTLEKLRPLMTQAVAIINGTAPDDDDAVGPQAAIDAMFGR